MPGSWRVSAGSARSENRPSYLGRGCPGRRRRRRALSADGKHLRIEVADSGKRRREGHDEGRDEGVDTCSKRKVSYSSRVTYPRL